VAGVIKLVTSYHTYKQNQTRKKTKIVENIETVKLYTEGLRKRKTMKNYILSEGPEG